MTDQQSSEHPSAAPSDKQQPQSAQAMMVLQLAGVAWIVLNQFRFHLGLHAGDQSGLVAKGYIGASLFFVATGYLVFQRFGREPIRWAAWRSFSWRQLAVTYPLHIVVLSLMLAGVVAAGLLGASVRTRFPLWDLPANVALIQAWGVLETDTWNFPSWLVSATWLSVVAFPLLQRAQWALRSEALAIAAPALLFVIGFIVTENLGVLFTDMTARIGALQMLPSFMLGGALWRLHARFPLPPAAGLGVTIASVVWLVAASLLRASDLLIWPAFAPLVLGAASVWRGGARPVSQSLSDIALAMQLIYLPVDILYFRALRPLAVGGPPWALWLVWGGVFPVIALATAAVHYSFQRPIANWLLKPRRATG